MKHHIIIIASFVTFGSTFFADRLAYAQHEKPAAKTEIVGPSPWGPDDEIGTLNDVSLM